MDDCDGKIRLDRLSIEGSRDTQMGNQINYPFESSIPFNEKKGKESGGTLMLVRQGREEGRRSKQGSNDKTEEKGRKRERRKLIS